MNSMTSQNKKAEKALVSKFITQLFEKNYSNANETLENLIEKKLKNKIKKTHEKCSCEKHGNLKKKKQLKEEVETFLNEPSFNEEESLESEIQEQQPVEGDFVISSSGNLGGRTNVSEFGGERLGTFADEETAENFLKKHMDQRSYYPNVWFNDDHGGYVLRKIQ